MDLKNARKHSTDILFVLLLFLVFTSSALAVILLGAKVYQNTASRMESNYTVRTALAYVTEKIRHADESGAISPGELDGLPALILSQEIEGTSYRTYLYFQDGALKELLTEASREVTPEQGTAIVSLAGFSIEKTEELQEALLWLFWEKTVCSVAVKIPERLCLTVPIQAESWVL